MVVVEEEEEEKGVCVCVWRTICLKCLDCLNETVVECGGEEDNLWGGGGQFV